MHLQRCDVAHGVGRDHRGIKLARIPELYAELAATLGDVRVSDDYALARPDHAGAVAAATGVNQHGGAAQRLRDFAESVDGSGHHSPPCGRSATAISAFCNAPPRTKPIANDLPIEEPWSFE